MEIIINFATKLIKKFPEVRWIYTSPPILLQCEWFRNTDRTKIYTQPCWRNDGYIWEDWNCNGQAGL